MSSPNDSQRQRMKQAFEDALDAASMTAAAAPPGAGDELAPGSTIGKCRIQKVCGRGGMGAVYLARHITLDVLVAVKVLPQEISKKHPDYAERFLREARIAARLKHPNVMSVMDADKDEATGLYYIVMEFCGGGSIRSRVAKGPLAENTAIQVINGVAKALVAAEAAGIVHRDIKPDNILLTSDGRVKLADLGLAKHEGAGDAGLTQSSSAIGTPYYMSPEQIRDSKRVDTRSDIYSLGATFYHLLVGKPPFPGDNVYGVLHKVMNEPTPDPRTARPDVSDSSGKICMKMMEKDAANRYQSPTELLSDLAKKAVPEALTPLPEGVAGGVEELELSGTRGPRSEGRGTRSGTRQVDLTLSELPGKKQKFAVIGAVAAAMILAFLVFALNRKDPTPATKGSGESAESKPADLPPPEPGETTDGGEKEPGDEPEIKDEPPVKPPPPDKPANTSERIAPAAPKKPIPEGALVAMTFEDATVSLRGNDRFLRNGAADSTLTSGYGTVHGNAGLDAGRIGRAMKFDGANDFVQLEPMEERTVSLWFKSNNMVQTGLLDGGSAGARNEGFQIGLFQEKGFKDGALNLRGIFVGFWTLDAVFPDEAVFSGWHHLVVSWDGARRVDALFDGQPLDGIPVVADAPFDGKRTSSVELPVAPKPGDAPTLVGCTRDAWWGIGSKFFNGLIDELAIWDRPMTLEEMTELYSMSSKGESYCEAISKAVDIEIAARKPVELEPPPPDKPLEVAGTEEPEKPAKEPEKDPEKAPEKDPGKTPVKPGKKLSLAEGCLAAFSCEDDTIQKGGADPMMRDLTGNGNDGTMHGGVQLTKGISGKCLDFDRDGKFLSFGPVAHRSLSIMVYCDSAAQVPFYDGGAHGEPWSCKGQGFIAGVYKPLGDGRFPHWNVDKPGFFLGLMTIDALVPHQTIERALHHFVICIDKDTIKFVVDGNSATGYVVQASGGTPKSQKSPMKVSTKPNPAEGELPNSVGAGRGELSGARWFRGDVDEIAIWDRVLTDDEIRELWTYASKKTSYCEAIGKSAK